MGWMPERGRISDSAEAQEAYTRTNDISEEGTGEHHEEGEHHHQRRGPSTIEVSSAVGNVTEAYPDRV